MLEPEGVIRRRLPGSVHNLPLSAARMCHATRSCQLPSILCIRPLLLSLLEVKDFIFQAWTGSWTEVSFLSLHEINHSQAGLLSAGPFPSWDTRHSTH